MPRVIISVRVAKCKSSFKPRLFHSSVSSLRAPLKTKLITSFNVTDASVHDSQEIVNLIDEKDENQTLYADSAYTGEDLHIKLEEKEVKLSIHEKGCKNKPLTEAQKASNKEKSKVRVRVEHVFGFVENSMNGSTLEYIGLKRTQAAIGMMNLVYNMFRKIQLQTV